MRKPFAGNAVVRLEISERGLGHQVFMFEWSNNSEQGLGLPRGVQWETGGYRNNELRIPDASIEGEEEICPIVRDIPCPIVER
jgi:hypothetical protein